VSLAGALEDAASALPGDADAIRPANGDPQRLLELLGSEGASRVLAWLLAERPAEGDELADAWAESEEGSEAVLSVSESALPKPGRKALRRIRHRLRSRGVAVAEAPREPVVARLPEVDDAFGSAWLSPIDPDGMRIAYLVEPNPGGGARLFEVVIDDARGVVGFEVYTAPRKKARAFLDDLRRRDRFPVTEVPADTARAVVAHALAAQPEDRPPPRGFFEWRSRVAEAPPGTPLPGALAAEVLEVRAEPSLLERAAELVRQGRLGPWPPPPSVLAELYERLRTSLESRVIVSGAARRQQLDDILGEALEEVFDAAGAARAAHRLRESAFVLWRHGDEDAARACLAAAAAFEAGSPRDNPVARALLEVPMRPALRSLEGASDEPEAQPEATASGDEPLIVKP
jgi:hypothetical protein